MPALHGPDENSYRFEIPKTYKVCGKGFVRKENLIAFGFKKVFLYHKRYRVLPALHGPAENTYRFDIILPYVKMNKTHRK